MEAVVVVVEVEVVAVVEVVVVTVVRRCFTKQPRFRLVIVLISHGG